MTAAIRVGNLVKTFSHKGGATEAVRGVSFVIEAGERIACIGPNGAGKSTTIKMLTGILHPTSGNAEVLGLVPWKDRRKLAANIGALFGQRSQLWAELPVRKGLELLAAIYKIEKGRVRVRIDEISETLDASELLDQAVRNLSLGQRMRCELAASLLHNPQLLFLDEPTIGLDLVAKQKFRELLVRLNETQGMTVFLTSHDIADVEAVANRTIIINHGRVLRDSATSELGRSLLSTKIVKLQVNGPFPTFVDLETEELAPGLYRIAVDLNAHTIREVLDRVLSQCDVADIEVTDPPLEDAIATIYQEQT